MASAGELSASRAAVAGGGGGGGGGGGLTVSEPVPVAAAVADPLPELCPALLLLGEGGGGAGVRATLLLLGGGGGGRGADAAVWAAPLSPLALAEPVTSEGVDERSLVAEEEDPLLARALPGAIAGGGGGGATLAAVSGMELLPEALLPLSDSARLGIGGGALDLVETGGVGGSLGRSASGIGRAVLGTLRSGVGRGDAVVAETGGGGASCGVG